MRGQAHARRALEVAAAGGHSLLMMGPPGAGKTMLAQRVPTILPRLGPDESLEVSCVYSVTEPERLRSSPVVYPPFRAPHHTLSLPALVGGGPDPRPGELSLAHHGVLFLDELSEFRPSVLEALRQPLEEGEVRISRYRRTVRFPARPLLIVALNPCPCGFRGDPVKPCLCPPMALERHRRCLGGPLMDRIDLRVELPRPDPASWEAPREGSAEVRGRVEAARARMRARNPAARPLNAHLRSGDLRRLWAPAEGGEPGRGPSHAPRQACALAERGRRLLDSAAENFALSPRARHRVLKVALTIADLEAAEQVLERHVAEAVQYRTRVPE